MKINDINTKDEYDVDKYSVLAEELCELINNIMDKQLNNEHKRSDLKALKDVIDDYICSVDDWENSKYKIIYKDGKAKNIILYNDNNDDGDKLICKGYYYILKE